MQSKPIRYRTSAIINGVYLNESLAPANGVHVGTLPLDDQRTGRKLAEAQEC